MSIKILKVKVDYDKTAYPKEVLEKAISEYQQLIKNGTSLCVEHIESNTIDVSKISHMVQTMEMIGDNIVSQINVFSTPEGNKLKELFDENWVRFYIEGTGTVDENGIVGDDFKLLNVGWEII